MTSKILIDTNFIMFQSMHVKAQPMMARVRYLKRDMCTSSLRIAIRTIFSVLDDVSKWDPTIKISDIDFADDSRRSFRYDIFPGYKSGRKKLREKATRADKEALHDMFICKRLMFCMFQALGCNVYVAKDYEADDVLGTLGWAYAGLGIPNYIYTTDKDLFQEADKPFTKIYRPMPGGRTLIDQTNLPWALKLDIKKKALYWDCRTKEEVILYKSIVGDTSDNYKGIPGMGDAKWPEILKGFRATGCTLGDLLENPITLIKDMSLTSAAENKLLNNLDDLFLSMDLATIRYPEVEEGSYWCQDAGDEHLLTDRVLLHEGGRIKSLTNLEEMYATFLTYGMSKTVSEIKNRLVLET